MREAAERAADELQRLADDITRALDTLPRSASAGTRELFEQHARRALAISAALRVEAKDPVPRIATLLLRARVVLASAVLASIGTVAVGAGEEVGADVWRAVKAAAEQLLEQAAVPLDVSDSPRPPTALAQELRRARLVQGFTQDDLADWIRVARTSVSAWERGVSLPPTKDWSALTEALELSPADLGELVVRSTQ